MEIDNGISSTCVDITKPTEEGTGITEKILTCHEAHKSINKIEIFNAGEGALKVFEFKILGMTTLLRLHFQWNIDFNYSFWISWSNATFVQINNVSFFCFIFIGVFQRNLLYANFTGFPDKSVVLDNNHFTYFQLYDQTSKQWFLRLNKIYQMKWILVSIRGGILFLFIILGIWKCVIRLFVQS